MIRIYLYPFLLATMASFVVPSTPVAAQPSVNLSAGHEESVVPRPRRFEMAASGTNLLTTGFKGKITIWNLEKRKPLFTTESDTQGHVAWLCDEQRHSLAYLLQNRDLQSIQLKLVDLTGQAEEKLIPLEIERNNDWNLQFNADATLLSATIVDAHDNREGFTKVFDLANGNVLYTGNPLGDGTRKASFIPNSDLLAVVATHAKPSLKLINFRTSEEVHSSSLVEGIGNVVASHDGKLLAAGCEDDTCKVFLVRDGTLRLHSVLPMPYESSDMAFLNNGQLAAWDDGNAYLWDIEQQQLKLRFNVPRYFSLTPDAARCVSYSENHVEVILSSTAGYSREKEASSSKWPDRGWLDDNATFTYNGSTLTVIKDRFVSHFNLTTSAFRSAKVQQGRPYDDAIAPDGSTLVLNDDTVSLLSSIGNQKGLMRFSGNERIEEAIFSQRGDCVAIFTRSRVVIVEPDGKVIGQVPNVDDRYPVLSDSGRWLFADGSLHDINRKMKVREFEGPIGFSFDERYLITPRSLLSLETLEVQRSPIPFHQLYRSGSLANDKPYYATLDKEASDQVARVRVWNYMAGNLVGTLVANFQGDRPNHVKISPDATKVVAFDVGWGETLHHWDITDWIEQDGVGAGAQVAPVVVPRWPVGGRTITASNGVRITIEADDAKIPEVDKALREVLRDLDTN